MKARTAEKIVPYSPFVLLVEAEPGIKSSQAKPLRAGDVCPACGKAKLDYDGLLNLACPQCGFSGGGGCFT